MWNSVVGALSTARAFLANGVLSKNFLDAASQSAGDFIDGVQSCALAGRFKLVRKRFGNPELFRKFRIAQLPTGGAEFFGKRLSDRVWHSCFIGERSSIIMDDLSCLQRTLAYLRQGELAMSANLSFPIDQLANPLRPSELASLVRQVLAENISKVERAVTAGAMTVAVPSEDHAIEIQDRCAGRVRFVIGECSRITETVPFAINWRQRTLEMKFSEMGAEEPSSETMLKAAPPM